VGIRAVHRNSPAWQAGLTGGDIVLAINSQRVQADSWSDRLAMLSVGEPYTVSYFSGDELKTTRINPVSNPNPEFTIEPVDKPTRQQKKVFKAWAGVDLPDA
jgi:Predicted protease with the C-terminal PDZ domain